MSLPADRSINWEKVARAKVHPVQIAVLDLLAMDQGRVLSPNEISFELQEPLGNVSYHVGVLVGDGLLRLVEIAPRRGALEHYYGLSDVALGGGE